MPLTFSQITPGDNFGVLTIDPEACRETFDTLFAKETNRDALSPAYLVALLMRGYLALLPDRPPGNVHAGQHLIWGTPPPNGTILSVELRCTDRQMKRGRRWLWFEVRLFSDRGTHLTAINASIWGA